LKKEAIPSTSARAGFFAVARSQRGNEAHQAFFNTLQVEWKQGVTRGVRISADAAPYHANFGVEDTASVTLGHGH
jgi:hypothetical protein